MSNSPYPHTNSDPFYDFDPNNRTDPKAPVYGLWGGYGSTMKTYSARGPMLNACATGRYSHRFRLFKLNGAGQWDEIAVKDTDAKNDTCDVCGGLVKDSWNRGQYPFYGWQRIGYAWDWDRYPNGKVKDVLRLLFRCKGCKISGGI